MKKILFYIEPGVFRQNPLLLEPWHGFCTAIARSSTDNARSFLVSSRAICKLPNSAFDECLEIDSSAVMASSGFDRCAYARDICQGIGFKNSHLLDALNFADRKLCPDFVISWTENRYLRRVFGDRVFF